ncbi:membrane protein [Thalassotalea insulae]|uniref:Membrane protein n=1 Tax=Thalassotalea insulae TaxID=2056778 RepID=A0ABQ6GTP0_9GAMM|nr:MAPEG family protein [Thalassotalea insulae]GLX79308.1 membrane protein [Thalassotalea insulae]
MTLLITCLFIALLLPYLAKIPVAIAMHQLGGYDNAHPRAQQAQLTGFGARALAAHQNSFESLIIFTPAILLAIATQHTGSSIQYLAITHVVSRIIYQLLYMINISILRSIAWGIATMASFAIVWQCF